MNVTIVFGTLTGVFVLFRFATKIFVLDRDFGLDDLFVLLAFLCGLPSTVMNIHGTAGHGEGQDIWNLEFDNIYKFSFWFYVLEVFYFAQVSILKMAFLFFYLRIFSGPAQKVLWGTIIFNALYGIAFCFLAAFQCTPVSFFWNGWDGEHPGKWCVIPDFIVALHSLTPTQFKYHRNWVGQRLCQCCTRLVDASDPVVVCAEPEHELEKEVRRCCYVRCWNFVSVLSAS